MLTGVIYAVFLSGLEVSLQTTIPWVNVVLHTVMPIVMLVDFLLILLVHRIRWREATVWCIYPTVYLVYSRVRGVVIDWSPYPFLDPRRDGGYPEVFGFSLMTLVGFLLVVWLLTELNAWHLGHQRSEHAA